VDAGNPPGPVTEMGVRARSVRDDRHQRGARSAQVPPSRPSPPPPAAGPLDRMRKGSSAGGRRWLPQSDLGVRGDRRPPACRLLQLARRSKRSVPATMRPGPRSRLPAMRARWWVHDAASPA
jgi:hypothetical protein